MLSAGPVSPLTPSNLTAEALATDQIQVSWQDNSPNEDGFILEADLNNSGTFVELATLTPNSTSYLHEGLSPGQIVSYRVRSFIGNASSDPTAPVSVATYAVPPSPQGLAASQITQNSLTLSWEASLFGEVYSIEQSDNQAGPFSQVGQVAWGNQSLNINGLNPGTTYFFRVLTEYQGLVSLPSNVLAATTQADNLSAPSNLSATPQATDKILVQWQDNSGEEDAFILEADIQNTGNFVEIANLGANVTSFLHEGLSYGQTVRYRVKARSGNTDSPYSNQFQTTTFPYPPGATNLKAISIAQTGCDLAWDPADFGRQYIIQQSNQAGGPYQEVGRVDFGTNQGSVNGLQAGNTYYFRIINVYKGQGSPSSNIIEVITPQGSLNAPSNLSAVPQSFSEIMISWVDNSDNET
ncbi:MAG: fibronectin type III domain-containing protein, partial [Bacteroidota bacterium]